MRKYKIIGLGGIGSHLVEPLCCYLNHIYEELEVVMIDGDSYEDKNRQRQAFEKIRNKAVDKVEALSGKFGNIRFKSKSEYVTSDNVITLIREDDTILLCVDNHATRKLVSDRCRELQNIVLVSGGNDYSDGNVIGYRRKDGADIGKPLTEIDLKIAKPEDLNPGDHDIKRAGCQEQIEQFPQLVTANLAAASHMLNVLVAIEKNDFDYEQVYFDTVSHRARPSPEKNLEINFD